MCNLISIPDFILFLLKNENTLFLLDINHIEIR